jgi:hypothetical protein
MGSMRSVQADTGHQFNPSELEQDSDVIMETFYKIYKHERNRALQGRVVNPTTPSSQVTGAGATAWNVDVEPILACVGGVMFESDEQADVAVHSSTNLLTNGYSCIAAICLKNVAGTVSQFIVKGAQALTGAQLPPTDAAIQSGAGAGNDWICLCYCTLNRTGDLTLTQSQDNKQRPHLSVNVATDFAQFV